MFSWIKKIREWLRERKRARNESIVNALKMAYHTFRILQVNNDRALDVMSDIDLSVREPSRGTSGLASQIRELLERTFELVDGLCRLNPAKSTGLFQRYTALSEKINGIVDRLTIQSDARPYCLFLDDISPELRGGVGGKAAPLADLKREGLPVPDGFVASIHVCHRLLKGSGIDQAIRQYSRKLEGNDVSEKEFERVADQIFMAIMDTSLDAELTSVLKTAYEQLSDDSRIGVSVRSSAMVEDKAEHSFAGQFESVLNVRGWEQFERAYKVVVASNFSARCLSYRARLGLPLADFDMAVLCQVMVVAESAGVLFTVVPGETEGSRMLISAVAGLGTAAVGGETPADLYYPDREGRKTATLEKIGAKTSKVVCSPDGGIETVSLPDTEKGVPLLRADQIKALTNYGLIIESLDGRPQDIEWGVDSDGKIWILQARPLRLPARGNRKLTSQGGNLLMKGGVTACPGRVVGRVKIIRGLNDFNEIKREPTIIVLHQSLVDVARWIPSVEGVIVDLGNPADHLSYIARENNCPMLTGVAEATEELKDGQLVVLDADRMMVMDAPDSIWPEVMALWETARNESERRLADGQRRIEISTEVDQLRSLIFPLNLTDTYGPTFSILECQTIHDIIRYVHEMAILSMFSAGDELFLGGGDYCQLRSDIPFFFQIIDLGGGIIPHRTRGRIALDDITSAPFLALWDGVTTPGIRWSGPPPVANLSGLISRSMLDQGSARPVGGMNYVLLAHDYLNLNARMDYHFTMVDAVCGSNYRDNYLRFRFKGGGTSRAQRERRARFIDWVLRENDFFTNATGDLVTGTLIGLPKETIRNRLAMIGRLLGFSRLMDAAMIDDEAPKRLAKAFSEGDYNLERFSATARGEKS